MTTGTLQRHRRSSLAATLVLGLLLTAMPQTTVVAHADPGTEAAFVAAVNRERSAAGLGALSGAGDLTSVARAHSQVMADGTNLHHNPTLGDDVSGWQKVGENVGRGPSVDAIHAALMASPGHKRNILDPEWTELGMGVVIEDGRIWVTQLFRTPAGAAAAAVTPPASTEAPDPELAPAPAVAPEPSPTPATDDPPVGTTAAAADSVDRAAPAAPAAPSTDAVNGPGPHEVIATPIALDRMTVTLARLEAAERSMTLEAVLG